MDSIKSHPSGVLVGEGEGVGILNGKGILSLQAVGIASKMHTIISLTGKRMLLDRFIMIHPTSVSNIPISCRIAITQHVSLGT